MLTNVLATIRDRRHASVADLCEFLKIPSVSAKSDHAGECARCADWLAQRLKAAALDVRIMPTGSAAHPGRPIVLAQNKHVTGRPTVLVYGHYDVQPPEPLDLWTTPAFEPTIRKTDAGTDAVYARGAVDDKGQVWAHVEALTAWQAHGGLPINVTVLIEGEEEVGSENLEAWVQEHKALLKADICVISDTGQFDRGLPALTYGLRGLVYEEVFLTGPSHDLHSGGYGGAVPNPGNILAKLIAALHDDQGRVTVPGFYDDVQPLTPAEREAWRKLPGTDAEFCKEVDIAFTSGEKGFTTLEKLWGRPTCDVNGLTCGYQGEGAKTVLPAKASAKISFRLVPNQDPIKIRDNFRAFVRSVVPANVKIEFAGHGASPAAVVPIDTKPSRLALEALEAGFGVKPTFIRTGGSIPVVGLLKRELGVDTLLIGFGLPDDRVHSPNEKMDLDAFYHGTETLAVLYEKLAGL